MPRPMLDERMTVRMPGKLLAVILDRAARTNCSANHVVLSSLEHDFARMDTYSLDYYVDILPLVEDTQGDSGAHCDAVAWTCSGGAKALAGF